MVRTMITWMWRPSAPCAVGVAMCAWWVVACASPTDIRDTDAPSGDATPPDTSTDVSMRSDTAADSPAATADRPGSVTIAGGTLVRNGATFLPRGLSLTGLVVTPEANVSAPDSVWSRAQANLADPEALRLQLRRFASWGVDTVRFQISQDGLDPENPAYDPTYLPLVVRTLRSTVDAGFIVVLSLRRSMPGETAVDPCVPEHLPCEVTERVWSRLLGDVADIGTDRRVILELYNEPLVGAPNTEASWAEWHPRHQRLIEQVREHGALNVLLVDGVRAGKFAPIDERYEVVDPLGMTAYGIHPYPLYIARTGFSYHRESDWESAFGAFCTSADHVCLATEWSTSSENSCYDEPSVPGLSSPLLAASILRFLESHQMGTILWPGDYPSAIVSDYRGTLTEFGSVDSFECSTTTPLRLGMGTMMRDYFTTGSIP